MATIRANVIGFSVTISGEVHDLSRDVCHIHPPCVHEAIGTASEEEIQHALDNADYDDWFDRDGAYRGPDKCGLGLRFEDGGRREGLRRRRIWRQFGVGDVKEFLSAG